MPRKILQTTTYTRIEHIPEDARSSLRGMSRWLCTCGRSGKWNRSEKVTAGTAKRHKCADIGWGA